MELFWKDMKRLPMLFLGFLTLALGIYLTKLSLLGMSSWSVFHDGVSIVSGLRFGVITQVVGLSILVLSMIFMKSKVGFGTIFNIVFVGWFIDVYDMIYSTNPEHIVVQYIVLILGVLFTTVGRSLYIASRLGPGPRDGLFVGLARITKIQVKYVKIAIELVVLAIGMVLGGTAGVGTVIIIIVSGYLVQFFFRIFDFDPKTARQSNVLDYQFQEHKNFAFIVSLVSLVTWLVPVLGIIVSTYGMIFSLKKNQSKKAVAFSISVIGILLSVSYWLYTMLSIDVLNLFT